MLQTARSYGGMVTAPHHLAAQAGLRVLNEGGNAIEAMIAAAATIAVVYPHMNALGGDNFWLFAEPGTDPVGIDAWRWCREARRCRFLHVAELRRHSEPRTARGPHRRRCRLRLAGRVPAQPRCLGRPPAALAPARRRDLPRRERHGCHGNAGAEHGCETRSASRRPRLFGNVPEKRETLCRGRTFDPRSPRLHPRSARQ